MERYLIRLSNSDHYTPKDASDLAKRIRSLLGSRESIGNLRISSKAIEFDLFARDKKELDERVKLLESNVAKTATLKLLDKIPKPMTKQEVLDEAIALFNEERYWEAHEVLEQVWQPAKGAERETIQGIILTAAGLVHHQKDRDKVSLGMLKKALGKLDEETRLEDINLGRLRADIQRLLDSETPERLTLIKFSQRTA